MFVNTIDFSGFAGVQPGPLPANTCVKRTHACTIRPWNSPLPIVPVMNTLFGSASCGVKVKNAVDVLPFAQSKRLAPDIERSAHVALVMCSSAVNFAEPPALLQPYIRPCAATV